MEVFGTVIIIEHLPGVGKEGLDVFPDPTPASTRGPGRSPSRRIASAVENIGVVLTMVDVIALPMVRMPRNVRTRVTPGTKRPTATKTRLSNAKIVAFGKRTK
jgi:hypothetical protein